MSFTKVRDAETDAEDGAVINLKSLKYLFWSTHSTDFVRSHDLFNKFEHRMICIDGCL